MARQCDAATRDNAFSTAAFCRVHRVFDARLLPFISVSVAAPTLMIATLPTVSRAAPELAIVVRSGVLDPHGAASTA